MDDLLAVLSALPGLLAIALLGRVALSWLPPGLPGRHAPRELPVTWAASHALGLIAVASVGAWAGLAGIGPWAPWLLAAAGLAAIARWAALPGRLVPRHGAAVEAPGMLARVAGLGVAALLVVPLAQVVAEASDLDFPVIRCGTSTGPFFGIRIESFMGVGRAFASIGDLELLRWTSLLALVVLLGHGLRCARRSPLDRRLVLLAFLASPVIWNFELDVTTSLDMALLAGGGCAFLIPWLRRADRRALALSALCFAACPVLHPGGAAIGAAGLAVLLVFSAAPSRAQVLRFGIAALLLVWLPHQLEVWERASPQGLQSHGPWSRGTLHLVMWTVREMARPDTWLLTWFGSGAALLLGLAGFAGARRGEQRTEQGVDQPGRELKALMVVFAAALLYVVPGREVFGHLHFWTLSASAPAGVLVAGLVFARAERP